MAAFPFIALLCMVLVHKLALLCGKDFSDKLWPAAVILIFMIYPGTSQKMFKLFKCEPSIIVINAHLSFATGSVCRNLINN